MCCKRSKTTISFANIIYEISWNPFNFPNISRSNRSTGVLSLQNETANTSRSDTAHTQTTICILSMRSTPHPTHYILYSPSPLQKDVHHHFTLHNNANNPCRISANRNAHILVAFLLKYTDPANATRSVFCGIRICPSWFRVPNIYIYILSIRCSTNIAALLTQQSASSRTNKTDAFPLYSLNPTAIL